MAIQFLLVTFPEQRSVLADGAGVGFTNHILMLPGDEYEITLDGSGYSPTSQGIALGGTSMVKPLVIGFAPTVAADGAPRSMPAPAAAEAKATPTAMPGTQSPSAKATTAKPGTKAKRNA